MTTLSPAGEHLIISGDRVPVAAYQAIYHKLTSKIETISEIFPDAYRITAEDIIQLDHLLHQAVVQYPVERSNSTCAVSLHKHEKIEPSSFDKFRVFNFSINKPTSKISYQFDFFTVLPVEVKGAENIVQRFKVSLIIDQDFVEETEPHLPVFLRSMMSGNNIKLKVEYSDYNVGRNLQVTVQDWVSTLESRTVSRWIKFLENRADLFSAMAPRAFAAASLVAVGLWIAPDSARTLGRDIFIGLAFASAMYVFGNVLINLMYRQLSEAKPLTFICLTKGDNERQKAMAVRMKTKSRSAILIGTLILVTIPVNIFSSLIYDFITHTQ